MVCYASSDTARCQCIVRDENGDKVYEVTLPATTAASTLLLEVAEKLNKSMDQIVLIFQCMYIEVEIKAGVEGTLEDLGLKTSHYRNNLLVREIPGGGGTINPNFLLRHHVTDTTTVEGKSVGEGSSSASLNDAGSIISQAPSPSSSGGPGGKRRLKTAAFDTAETTASSTSNYSQPSTSLPSTAPPNFVGLVNQAMTCYLNSLLQALYMTPEFRNALYKWKFDGDKPSNSIPYQLQKLFLNLQTSSRCAVETTELTLSFGWGTGDVWHQHDVQELCRVMFDALEQEFKNTAQADLINQLYQGKMIDYVKCLECGREKSREDTFLDIPLPVRPYGSTVAYSSIEEAMRAFVTPEILDGNNQYHCDNCDKKCNAHKGLKFSKFPYLLTLHLKRFDFDYSTLHRIKLNDKVVFPEVLELDFFLKYPTPNQMEISKCDDGSCSIADSALGDDAASTSAAPPLPPELNSPPTDHELNEDEGIVWDKCGISMGEGSSSSSSSGSYSGSEGCDAGQTPANSTGDTGRTSRVVREPVGDLTQTTVAGERPQAGGDSVMSEVGSNKSGSRDVQPMSCDTRATSDSDLQSPLSGSLPPDIPDQTVPQTEDGFLTSAVSNSSGVNSTIESRVPEVVTPVKAPAELRYELYSIMIHSGSASGGHYYAYIKDFASNHWFCFNDQSVTRVTVEDIEKSYGGGPTRGYYSGVYSPSTNAYMLMYRLIDPERNCLPMTPDQFPSHIKCLVEEIKLREEQERRMRARDEETLKLKVCYQSTYAKILVHRDDPFSDALNQAYESLEQEIQVKKEDCRLVSYCISRDSRDCSLEDKEEETIGKVLAFLESSNCSTDFLLETKHSELTFPVYRPDDLRIDICRVHVPKEEVLEVQQVQVPFNITVGGLKRHLRLLIPEVVLPPLPTDLVLVMYHYSERFPTFCHLSDEQVLMNQLIDSSTYYKIFIAPLSPLLAADLENGFEKSNFYKFLKKVENVVILHLALPEVSNVILERLMIPRLSEFKLIENNNKQDFASGENNLPNNSGTQPEEESGAVCAVTSSDQSTSEDSSLTDSERTIIGDPQQDQLLSPSYSETLSSPEINMAMEMNGDAEGEEDESDEMDNRTKSNRDHYIKVTCYLQNEQRMLKIVVDRMAEWSLVEKYLEQQCGVHRQFLHVTTGLGEVARSSDKVRELFLLKHHDFLSVRLHRPLAHNEYKKKLYKFLPNSPQPFQYLCDWIVVRGQTVGESKRALLKYLEFLRISYNRCRLRRKNWKAVGQPWLDNDVWDDSTKQLEGIVLEELETDEPVTSHDMVPVFLRRFYPSNLTFSHFIEIVIDTSQPFDLIKRISEISFIPVDHISVAKSNSPSFPWEMSVYTVLQELDWLDYSQDSALLCSNTNFKLDLDENTPTILYRDNREEKKKVDRESFKKMDEFYSDWRPEQSSSRFDQFVSMSRRSSERMMMQSPRREKPLKIYLQNKTTSPSSSPNTTVSSTPAQAPAATNTPAPVAVQPSSESTNNCYVPPPDYDY